jgi:uncharacterized protein (TIGR02594 family)
MIQTSAFLVAKTFLKTKEVPGPGSNLLILYALQRIGSWVKDDETAWCSAFLCFIAHILGLPNPNSLSARKWLLVGESIRLDQAEADCDVVILKRGGGNQPGPEVIDALGHVGLFAGLEDDKVLVLAGNQHDEVNITAFPINQILGLRRLI